MFSFSFQLRNNGKNIKKSDWWGKISTRSLKKKKWNETEIVAHDNNLCSVTTSLYPSSFPFYPWNERRRRKRKTFLYTYNSWSLFFSYVVYFVSHPSTNLFIRIRLFISSSNNLKNFNHDCIISAVCVFLPFRPL